MKSKDSLTTTERSFFKRLKTPDRIQAFLDELSYSTDSFYRTPRQVLADRRAHCFDGALVAAAALQAQGHPALLMDLRTVNDDDHVLALFYRGAHIGAIGKSNFAGLRFREPIYRSLRELVMSYFESYYNSLGQKTLRAYSVPLKLSSFDKWHWTTNPEILEKIAYRLDDIRHFRILTRDMERSLLKVDARSYRAGMVGVKKAGLYQP